MSERSSGRTSATGGASSATGLTLRARNVPAGRSRDGERGAQRERLELGAEAAAVGLGEPLVGTADGVAVDAG